ncbi:MAG: methylenetetrahydrofolate reductase [Elusimicrobiota bacterium]
MMKISDIYSPDKTVFSCEVFPPKPENDIDIIYGTIEELKEIAPDFLSVTYGAGGGTRLRTLEISSRIKNTYKMESLMHLTCIDNRSQDILKILKDMQSAGIENILALRGDIADKNPKKEDPSGDFEYAGDLVQFIHDNTDLCIGVAGYPEIHPESGTAKDDIQNLRNKVRKGASFIISQLFFQNDFFYSFLDKFLDSIAADNLDIHISAGIMPVFKANLLNRIISLSGSTVPLKLQSLIDKYGDKPEDMEKAGIDYASRQIEDLIRQQVDGIHLYTMNNAQLAKTIAHNAGLR